MNYEQLYKGLLSSIYRMDEQEQTALLNADGATEESVNTAIATRDAERISKLNGKFQEGYAKGKSESLSNFEKQLREKFQITDTDKLGLDLVDQIVTAAKGQQSGQSQLTDDQVRQHPAYLELEKKAKADLKKTATEWETKYNQRESDWTKQQHSAAAKDVLRAELKALKPLLPKSELAANNLLNSFLNSYESQGIEFIKQQDGSYLPVKDGKPLQDNHGYSVSLADLVKRDSAQWFDFEANNGGGNSNNNQQQQQQQQNNNGGNGYPASIPKPETFEKLYEIIQNGKQSQADKEQAFAAWQAENPE